MTSRAVLEQRLAELEAAKHKLLTGTTKVEVQYEGTKVAYRATSADDLKLLNMAIFELRAQLGQVTRRSIGVRFG